MDAEYCRAKARELREQARTANDPINRAHLLMMAEQYYWFAGWIEAQPREREEPWRAKEKAPPGFGPSGASQKCEKPLARPEESGSQGVSFRVVESE